jgi:hypothetical protein
VKTAARLLPQGMNRQIKPQGVEVVYCVDLSSASDTAQVGGKAANLAKAISLGMSVPTGFVLIRDALVL